jgi:putative hemolysin
MYACQLKNKNAEIKDDLRQPLFVPETMTTDSLLEEFKNNRTEIAIVIDEFGGMAGIISLEDVLEEVFGSVEDEFDDEEKDIKKVGENKYIINGLYRVEDFFEFFNLSTEEDEVETIGGLVQKHLCSLGKVNDEVEINNLKIKVIEVKKRRINKILVEQTITNEVTNDVEE